MIASGATNEEVAAQTLQNSSSGPSVEPAAPPLSDVNARIEALATEIREARGFQPVRAPEPSEKPSTPPEASPQSAPPSAKEAPPRFEPRRLGLIPFIAAEQRSDAPGSKSRVSWKLLGFAEGKRLQIAAIAAGFAAIGLIGAVTLYERSGQAQALALQKTENELLAATVRTLKTKVEALEVIRARDDTADLRKTIGEVKAGLASSRESAAALAQLAARFDKSQHDQDARLAKLSDKVDHDAASRNADLVARIEKLEKNPAAPIVAALPPPVPAPASPAALPKQPAVLPQPAPVSRDVTGSIARPRPPLHDWVVRDVHDGIAMIEGRDGEREVSAGDLIPGAGRVERIERRGRDWAVVTNLGTIVGDEANQY